MDIGFVILMSSFGAMFYWLLRETDYLRVNLCAHLYAQPDTIGVIPEEVIPEPEPSLYQPTEFIPADMPESKLNSFIMGGRYVSDRPEISNLTA